MTGDGDCDGTVWLNMWYTREPREASRHHDEVLHKSTVKSKDCDSILTEGQNKIEWVLWESAGV